MNISRRNALLGSVAAAALPIPALASDSPDSTLRTLWAEYVSVRNAEMDAYNEADSLEMVIRTEAGLLSGPELPDALKWYWSQTGAVVDAAMDPTSPLYQGDDLRKVYDGYMAEVQEHAVKATKRRTDDPRAVECRAGKSRADEHWRRADELRARILATPARTFEGLRIKAAAVARDIDLEGDCLGDVPGDELFAALADDLRHLANG